VIADVNTPAEPIENGSSKWVQWSVCHAKAIVGTTLPWRVCADEHSPPSLEESNITGARVIKALPHLETKVKRDSSME